MNIRIQWLVLIIVVMSLMLVGCAQPNPQVVVVTVEVTAAPEEEVVEEETPAEEEVDIEATVQAGIDAAIAATKAIEEAVQAAVAATQAAQPAQPSASDTLAAQPTNTPVPAAPAPVAVAPTATPVPPPTAAPVVQTTATETKVIYHDGDYNNGVGTYASDKAPWLDLLVKLDGIWYGPERSPEDGINAVPLPAGYRWTAGGGFGANPNGEAWWDGPNYIGEAILYNPTDTLVIKVPLGVEFYSVGGGSSDDKKCDDHDPKYPDCSSHNSNSNSNHNSNSNSSHNSNSNSSH